MTESGLPGNASGGAASSSNAGAADASTKSALGLFAENPIGAADGARPGARDARTPKLPSFDGRRATSRGRRAAAGGVVLAWLLSLTVLGMCGAAAVIWRGDVMRAWPPSERAYVALGLR